MENQPIKRPKATIKRRAHLPRLPFHQLALSLSGGGFRGTCTHLGLMSYLSTKTMMDLSLLERTRILSSVSGGTFLGVKYAATLKRGGNLGECYKSLVDFMTRHDLVEDALQYLAEDGNWTNGRQRSLINAFAAIYYRDLESASFGLLWNETPAIHLKEISFNATEFNFALPFHFQKTEFQSGDPRNLAPEHIGNKKLHIPVEMAKEVRLADIIAASSCVPFGFEPINFPDDFIHPGASALRDRSLLPQYTSDGEKIQYPIGLMDGGVDDNQGVDAVIRAEDRLKNYPDELKEFRSQDKKAVDLYIISDGTNPTMQSYMPRSTDKIPYIGAWSFQLLQYMGISGAVIGCLLILFAALSASKAAVILFSCLGTMGILMALVFLVFSRGFVGLTRRLGVPAFFERRLRHVDRLKFATLNNLLVNRRNSAVKMITKVSIKQMRWFGFERIYGDAAWQPRVVMNAAFELTPEEVEKRKKKYPYLSAELTDPGEKIMAVAAKTLKKGTTLWFTAPELKGEHNMANSIIACGQFTMCFNLLEYFERFIHHPKYQSDYEKYSPELKQGLLDLRSSLMADWQRFRQDPYWMVTEWRERLWVEKSE